MTATAIAPVNEGPTANGRADEEKGAELLAEIVKVGDLFSRVWRLDDDMRRAGYDSPFDDEYDSFTSDLRDAVFAYVRALGRG
ncbi:hypothetical protein J8F10_29700 [Gemmata sp. G18]|uniref:Uncharacterized protein n=1 Tax=Gemmata palustris TaxID=2822762 RepID=A0ABS5C0C3_9BACT|nr:hypothetical protein [Gemmata palustris]MBP3959439.1 hypothetical protein [Gemmata palustris]